MSITLGKILIDDNWEAMNLKSELAVVSDRNDDNNFTNYDGGFTQSLNDLLVVKLLEVAFHKTELENPDADKFFIPCTDENQYWVQIIVRGNNLEIEIGEPAA